MHSRKLVLRAFITSLITIFLVVVIFAGVGTTLATPAVQEGETPETESEALANGHGAEGVSAPEMFETVEETNALTYYYHMSGLEFEPWSSDTTYTWDYEIGCEHITGGDAYLYAPLHLPSDAKITRLRLYFMDTSAAQNGTLYLLRFDDGNSSSTLTSVSSTGSTAGAKYVDSAVVNFTVNNWDYAYGFEWDPHVFGNTVRICGVKVTYTPPSLFSSLPLIWK
jgi:hypothetical protein